MIADLALFLVEHSRRPHAWGEVDCSLVLADWGLANGYPDVAAHLRGSYATEDGCRAVIATAGGVLPLVADCAGRAGLAAIERPQPGAIGVIGSRRIITRQWGAIFDGRDWQVRLMDGFMAVKSAPLAIWRI